MQEILQDIGETERSKEEEDKERNKETHMEENKVLYIYHIFYALITYFCKKFE